MSTSSIRGIKMVHKIGAAVFGAGALLGALCQEVKYRPLSVAGLQEFGMLQSGRYGNNPRFNDEWLDHFGAFMTQSADVNENLSFTVGLGGIFEHQKREVVQSKWGGTQYKNFFIGPTVADFVWRQSGDGEGLSLQVGHFPYKYNPDAVNLGEYMFRSGPYPTYMMTGIFATVNNTAATLQGMRLGWKAGDLSADLMVTTEVSMPALYDLSGAAMVGYKVADGLLDLGAGVNWKHMVPVKPSRTTPQRANNSYFKKDNRDYTGFTAYYNEQVTFLERRVLEDSTAAPGKYDAQLAAARLDTANVNLWLSDPVANGIKMEYYTQAGILLMGRAAIDFKKLIPIEALGPQDLRLYSEIAVLGVQNYPVFYNKITERMPIMAGFNLPGFRILDLIALQVEVFNSPWMNSFWETMETNAATPSIPDGTDKDRSQTEFNDISKRDNLSWTVLLRKDIAKKAWISAQFARDHARTVSVDTWSGMGLEPIEVLGADKDWYWMVQFGFGI